MTCYADLPSPFALSSSCGQDCFSLEISNYAIDYEDRTGFVDSYLASLVSTNFSLRDTEILTDFPFPSFSCYPSKSVCGIESAIDIGQRTSCAVRWRD
jgi:hypothetical protein